jgi:predicted RNA-binding protein YlxR (DUF448 family)
MTRVKHKPQRTCVACRTIKDKRDLLRIVRTPDGQVILDATGKANGRGMYLCKTPECWEKGLKKERLSHALNISVGEEDLQLLWRDLQAEFTNS